MRRLAFIATIALAAIVACGVATRIYEGRFFVEERQCLATSSSLDVVEGEPTSARCAPVCLAQPLSDGGRALYVSTMCAPYPYPFDASGGDPQCPNALAALERKDSCYLDGGSANPAPADAGPDGLEDASADAGEPDADAGEPDADAGEPDADAGDDLDADVGDAF